MSSAELHSDITISFKVSTRVQSRFVVMPSAEPVLKFKGSIPSLLDLEDHNLGVKVVQATTIVCKVSASDQAGHIFQEVPGQMTLELSTTGACSGDGLCQ